MYFLTSTRTHVRKDRRLLKIRTLDRAINLSPIGKGLLILVLGALFALAEYYGLLPAGKETRYNGRHSLIHW
jgi:hypothetical protein